MNNADINEILAFACAASESGFQRVQIDPKDAIEIIDQRNELLEALERLVKNAQKQSWSDHYPADMDKAYAAIAKARGQA